MVCTQQFCENKRKFACVMRLEYEGKPWHPARPRKWTLPAGRGALGVQRFGPSDFLPWCNTHRAQIATWWGAAAVTSVSKEQIFIVTKHQCPPSQEPNQTRYHPINGLAPLRSVNTAKRKPFSRSKKKRERKIEKKLHKSACMNSTISIKLQF